MCAYGFSLKNQRVECHITTRHQDQPRFERRRHAIYSVGLDTNHALDVYCPASLIADITRKLAIANRTCVSGKN